MTRYYIRARVPVSGYIGDLVQQVFKQDPPIADLALKFDGDEAALRAMIGQGKLIVNINRQPRKILLENVITISTQPIPPLR